MPGITATPTESSRQSNKPIWFFLAGWLILNAVQAATLEIHADEAYYWLYSRFLDWGYYDHPPMVALFIRFGYSIFHNEFGLRLLTVISSPAAIYVLWLIVKKYNVQAKWFILLVSGVFILHIYGFTTTPDAPLFLFTVLFYYVFKKYLEKDGYGLALLMALVIAGLLYSKYHGILVVGFTVLSNLQILKRRSFWLIAILSVVLYSPHIIWQVVHEYPSITYHLFERSDEIYKPEQTYTYLPGQLLMAGPLIGWFLFYALFRTRMTDGFIRCLTVNCAGTFIFFFINTWKGEVQPHWTLIAFVPLIMLALIYLQQKKLNPQWLTTLAYINLAAILVCRIGLIVGANFITQVGQLKSSFGFREWVQAIHAKAGDAYVVMNEGFQNPSKYDFYTKSTKAMSYDSRYYRRTQFEIWPIEDSMQHKRVYYMLRRLDKNVPVTDTIKTNVGTWYGVWVDSMRSYQKVVIDSKVSKLTVKAGSKYTFDLTLHNPYKYPISFTDSGYMHQVVLGICLFKGPDVAFAYPATPDFHKLTIPAGQTARYQFVFTAPLQKGRYDVLFSLRTTPFYGGRNSRIIDLTIN